MTNANTAPKTSDTLRQWRFAHANAKRAAAERQALPVGADPAVATECANESVKWAEECEWLYSLLTPDDAVTADREASR